MLTGGSFKHDALKFNEGIANLEDTLEAKTKAKAESCPLCKQRNTIIIDSKSADIICSKCGMVVSDKLVKSEWQTTSIGSMQAETRAGPPISLARHDMGLSTLEMSYIYSHDLQTLCHSYRVHSLQSYDSIHLHGLKHIIHICKGRF